VLKPFEVTPIAAAIIATLSTQGVAAQQHSNTFSLNKVTVAATRSEQKQGDVASTVSVIDGDTIENNLSSNIRELIRYEPGVEVGNGAGDAARFGAKGFNIRGMDENRVKITVDGIDQANSFAPAGNPFQRAGRNYVDIDTMKRVEIVKGPASTLYGSDALGGLVVYTTKDPADYLALSGDDTGGSIKLRSGSADASLSQTLTLANRSGQFESLVIYSNRDADELENYEGSGSHLDKQDFDSANLLLKLQYQVSDKHRVGLTVENYRADTYTDISSKLDAPYYSDFYYGDDSTGRRRVSVFHQWRADTAAFESVDWQLDWQDSEIDQETHSMYGVAMPVYRIKDYRQAEELTKLSAQFAKQIDNHQLTYGFEYQAADLANAQNTLYPTDASSNTASRAVPKVNASNYGLYIQDHITLMRGKMTITPGVRYDNFESEPKIDSGFVPPEAAADALTDHDSDKITFRLGSVYNLSDITTIFAQYSQGFKAPEPIDLFYASERNYGPGNHFLTLPNSNLEAEESDSYEIGLRMDGRLGNFEAVIFYSDYTDFIEESTVSGGTGGIGFDRVTQSQNIDKASIKGAELRGAIWLDETVNAPAGTSLQVSLAYADGDNDTDDKPLESISPMKAVVGLGYDDPSNTWGGALNWTLVKAKSTSDLEAPDDFSARGYGKVDMTGYYHVNKNLVLRAGIVNMTDKEYWVYEDMRGKGSNDDDLDKFTQPGRNFSASVKYEF